MQLTRVGQHVAIFVAMFAGYSHANEQYLPPMGVKSVVSYSCTGLDITVEFSESSERDERGGFYSFDRILVNGSEVSSESLTEISKNATIFRTIVRYGVDCNQHKWNLFIVGSNKKYENVNINFNFEYNVLNNVVFVPSSPN